MTARGIGLRPLSVAHVRLSRNYSSNDLSVSWMRRTRIGGDSWEQSDVPLAEDGEKYEVDILSGAVVKRTIFVTSPVAVYTSAQQIADLGVAPALPLSVAVHQMSAIFGRGSAREEVLNG